MKRILFVDDEPNVLAGLRRMLRVHRSEWDMSFAEGGHEALQLFDEQPFDVVVSDMRMPKMDGAELLSRVQEGWPSTVRLVLSGQSDHELTLRAIGPAQQYLSKPCDPTELYNTIARTLDVHHRLESTAVQDLVGQLAGLPTLPETYAEIVAEMDSPDASVDVVSAIIARDVGMSAKVLQLINSSFFGLPVHVESVSHAAALLGLNVLRPLVLSSEVFQQFSNATLGGFPLPAFVDHSLSVAMLGRRIASLEGATQETIDNSLLAGLMHDVGQLVLARSLPQEYAEVRRAADEQGRSLGELELEFFGATHPEVGGYLLSLWGLPIDIVEAVMLHHEPGKTTLNDFAPLTAVHAAEVIAAGLSESVPEGAQFAFDYAEAIGRRERFAEWQACWDHPVGETCSWPA